MGIGGSIEITAEQVAEYVRTAGGSVRLNPGAPAPGTGEDDFARARPSGLPFFGAGAKAVMRVWRAPQPPSTRGPETP